jgi:hypothetical protein
VKALEAETLTWAELAEALREWAINPSQVVRDFESGTMPLVLYRTACLLDWFDKRRQDQTRSEKDVIDEHPTKADSGRHLLLL